ncbi:Integrase catalytic region [Thermodesulfobium narugense DSM 14796]|uniref:Integrase catalytic region n=1 Tax=Thermodesulfobium narugense DSM 14796 TaxID=747365 RepID=M1E459_9BACT|nr:IS21 family transposase [Thermodesulfobium narugense]AEE13732.1 Integrase catalytic region [Thermodesulfobium narugense DSM 14796]
MIHTLYAQGVSIRKIAHMLGINRRTVSKRLKEKDLEPYSKRTYPSKLDKFKDYINKRISQAHPDKIPSTVLLNEIKDIGYEGSLRILQEYTKSVYDKLKLNKKENEEIIRFETDRGFQAQVDWTTVRSGKKPIYAFVMVLSYSRAAFVYFTDNMWQDTFQSCHIKAFDYFGGIPKTILYDNLKSVVIQRDKYGQNEHGFNNKFLDFSKGLFIPKLCKPYRAKTKGKVERFNLYLKNNFYKPLKAKLKNTPIDITPDLLNAYIFSWLTSANNRIHATTNKKPFDMLKEELSYLSKVPNNLFVSEKDSNKNNIKDSNKNSKKEVYMDKSFHPYYTNLSEYEKLLIGEDNYA